MRRHCVVGDADRHLVLARLVAHLLVVAVFLVAALVALVALFFLPPLLPLLL